MGLKAPWQCIIALWRRSMQRVTEAAEIGFDYVRCETASDRDPAPIPDKRLM
jgi:hypothetical protein